MPLFLPNLCHVWFSNAGWQLDAFAPPRTPPMHTHLTIRQDGHPPVVGAQVACGNQGAAMQWHPRQHVSCRCANPSGGGNKGIDHTL
jgi:hypothetical protein